MQRRSRVRDGRDQREKRDGQEPRAKEGVSPHVAVRGRKFPGHRDG